MCVHVVCLCARERACMRVMNDSAHTNGASVYRESLPCIVVIKQATPHAFINATPANKENGNSK